MKIKFKLEKFEKALVFQILEQDGSFMGGLTSTAKYSTCNGIDILSSAGPYIYLRSPEKVSQMFLRGYKQENDFFPAFLTFSSNTARDTAYDDIITALKDWSKNWKGFKDCVEKEGVYSL